MQPPVRSKFKLPTGQGVAYRHRKIIYLALLPDRGLLDAIIEELARVENLNVAPLPDGVRSRARGGLRFFFNYGPEPVTLHLPRETKFLIGGAELPVAAWQSSLPSCDLKERRRPRLRSGPLPLSLSAALSELDVFAILPRVPRRFTLG